MQINGKCKTLPACIQTKVPQEGAALRVRAYALKMTRKKIDEALLGGRTQRVQVRTYRMVKITTLTYLLTIG